MNEFNFYSVVLTDSQRTLDDRVSQKTGSGVALFHSNSIPAVSQALDLVIVNALHTICSALCITLGVPS